MEEEHFSNEHQKELAVQLLGEGYTVWCDPNTEITLYLEEGELFTSTALCDTPYDIHFISACNEQDSFATRLVLRANWSEVED